MCCFALLSLDRNGTDVRGITRRAEGSLVVVSKDFVYVHVGQDDVGACVLLGGLFLAVFFCLQRV